MKNPVRNSRSNAGATRPTKGHGLKKVISTLRVMLFGFATLVLVWGAYQSFLFMNKPVQEIEFVGDMDQETLVQIRQQLSAYLGSGLLSLDLDALQSEVEQTPWVAQARISREWPSGLQVDLRQHRLVARWGSDAYVSDEGVVVSGYESEQGLPLLQASGGEARDLLGRFRMLSQALSQIDLSLDELHESQSGDLRLVLKNGIQLEFGSKDLLGRIQRFIAIWNLDLHQRVDQIDQIDVRYANGLAVDWNSGAKQDAALINIGDAYGELARR